jgi:hypothetical protein
MKPDNMFICPDVGWFQLAVFHHTQRCAAQQQLRSRPTNICRLPPHSSNSFVDVEGKMFRIRHYKLGSPVDPSQRN